MKKDIITDLVKLKIKSEEVSFKEAKSIIKDLEDSLDIKKGISLSAIQIGINKQVSIIRVKDIKINLINPKILQKYIKIKHKEEGCLSLSGLRIDTIRYINITIKNNNKIEKYEGLLAFIIQHEVSHMNGRTIIDDKWRKSR